MKTLGIVGGLGPESTIDYYKLLISGYRGRVSDGSYPHFLLNSVDFKKFLDAVTIGDLDSLTKWFVAAFEQLARAGADFGLMAANTPHIVFDRVAALSPIPLLSIVEAAVAAVKKEGLTRVALFGTRFTMQGGFYQSVMIREGISLVLPNQQDIDWIHKIYLGELIEGVFLPRTRDRLLEIIEGLRQRENIDALFLAGTELPLILRADEHQSVKLLDTTQIHVTHALDEMLLTP